MLKRIVEGDDDVVSFELISRLLAEGSTVRIGRATDSTFVLHSTRCPRLISRNHAVLRKAGDKLILQDLESTNGT
jgi:pSer/pThr/pTyr-binding forkhead associated (FHA) protein